MITLLVTGSGTNNHQMEVIDESENVTKICPQALNFPYSTYNAFGSSLEDNSKAVMGYFFAG